jgi:hypothetical protein
MLTLGLLRAEVAELVYSMTKRCPAWSIEEPWRSVSVADVLFPGLEALTHWESEA